MSVLAIDTSARRRFVAIRAAHDGTVLDAVEREGSAGEAIGPALARLVDRDLAAVVVVTGPGSFTGLRVGLAAALGVAHSMALPLHGVGALDVVAAGLPPGSAAHAVSDAGRGYVYIMALGPDGRRAADPYRMEVEQFLAEATPVVTCDTIPGLGDARDSVAALAAAVPLALASPPLRHAGLQAEYLGAAPHRTAR